MTDIVNKTSTKNKTGTTDKPDKPDNTSKTDAEYIDIQLVMMTAGMYPSLARQGEIATSTHLTISHAPAARGYVSALTPQQKADLLALHIRQLSKVISRLKTCGNRLNKHK